MKYVRYLRFIIPILFFCFVFWQALFAHSLVMYESDLTERTPGLGVLLPAGRVQKTDTGLIVLHEPLYVDVTVPPRAYKIILTLTTSNNSAPFTIGVRQSSDWDYSFPQAEVEERGGIRLYRITVSDWDYLEPSYALRFLISSPQLKPGDITISKARVSIEREAYSWAWFAKHLKNFL